MLHFLLRRSKSEGSQEHSLDVQRAGCQAFATARGFEGRPAEHVSDGVAGDDVEGLVALRRLLETVKPGDVVVCRDHSRLGRDMLESAMSIRTLVEDRKAQLFYYSSGEQVQWRNATDAVMSVLRGFGAQSEVENIRSRTSEALRARASAGRIAGGSCFGYTNMRQKEGGREYTTAVVNEAEAEIVRRIFCEYIAGAGITAIAKGLNVDHVPPPGAGTRRGTGSWAAGAVREILRRERYIGVYVHGKVKRKRAGGKRKVMETNAANALRTEVPEWRIIDDITWQRAQETIGKRAAKNPGTAVGKYGRHALSGIARCSHCGSGLTLGHTKVSGGVRVKAYCCSYHWKRGAAVCPVALRQPQDEVEEMLAAYLLEMLSPIVLEEIRRVVRLEAEKAFPLPAGIEALEGELASLKTEQKRLARAVAMVDDVDELVVQLRDRNERIKVLEAQIAVGRHAPEERTAKVAAIENAALAFLGRIRDVLAGSPEDAREAYTALFPAGILMTPSPENGHRRVWVAEGVPSLAGANTESDPTVSLRVLALPKVTAELRRPMAA